MRAGKLTPEDRMVLEDVTWFVLWVEDDGPGHVRVTATRSDNPSVGTVFRFARDEDVPLVRGRPPK